MTARSIVILTGAGISQESGIATFRSEDGLWAKHRIEDVCTPGAYRRNPVLVQDFYNARRKELAGVEPNAAHLALAKLEKNWPGEFLLVTQNIDDLHDRAGSKKMIHMHGALKRGLCTSCEEDYEWLDDMSVESRCPKCGKVGSVRPWIVWFEEMPYGMDEIYAALGQCDLFISIGTSGNVYPAASFVNQASRAKTIELNLEPSLGASRFQDGRYGPATKVVPVYVEELLAAL
ncbi:NAD-dependent protein deacylase [Alphaproteobacteria bacterium]|nr:NAD-dependent protein deacylase [Alphaproteobacteria bacterium]